MASKIIRNVKNWKIKRGDRYSHIAIAIDPDSCSIVI